MLASARKLAAALGAAVAVAAMLATPPAIAAATATSPNTVNLGYVPLDPSGYSCGGYLHFLQQTDSVGTSYGPAAAGVVTSWTTMAQTHGTGTIALEVWRPVGTNGAYQLVFTSPYVAADQAGQKTFTMPTPFPVLPGDRWGIGIQGPEVDTCVVSDGYAGGDTQMLDYPTYDPNAYPRYYNGNPLNLYATVTYDDVTAPTVTFNSDGVSDGASYPVGSVPAAPTCSATDSESGVNSAGCVVSGYSTALGAHTLTATATDKAGNTATITRSYTVVPVLTTTGFYAPVDMGGVVNTVKGGSTVPVKFTVKNSSGAAVTDTAKVGTFSAAKVSCSRSATTDSVEVTTTGTTSLRYDATAGQFIYSWQTPKAPGSCYRLTLTAGDGSTTTALFQLK